MIYILYHKNEKITSLILGESMVYTVKDVYTSAGKKVKKEANVKNYILFNSLSIKGGAIL